MPLHLPPEVDRAWLEPLADLEYHRGEWVPTYQVNGEYRRAITAQSPALFAIVYLGDLLSSRETAGRTSLAGLHLRMANLARAWKLRGVRPPRDAVIAARGAAKSTWGLVIIPLWALAHEWREFVLGFSDSTDQIRLHIGAARARLAENPWLREDYPGLQPWAGGRGRQDSALTYISRSGRALVGRSIRARTLGIQAISARPDVLVLDDIEPEGARYSEREQARILDTVLHKLLPMNEQAALLWLGTTTRYGSLAHQLADAARGRAVADWIVDEGIRVIHEPPVHGTGQGARSFWAQRYALDYLGSIAHTRNYAINFANDPPEPGGEHFTEATFRRAPRRELGPLTMSIDPATTVTDESDYTAFTVGGRTGRVVQVLYARAWRLRSTQIRERAQMIIAANPEIRTVILESNIAGDWAHDVLEPVDPRTRERVPLAPGVKVDTYSASRNKAGRIARLLDHYEGTIGTAVEHVGQLDELETQAKHWPAVEHDDLLDSDAALVEYLAGSITGT